MKAIISIAICTLFMSLGTLRGQSIALSDLMLYLKQDQSSFNDFVMNTYGYSYHGSVDDINAKGQLYIKSEYFNGRRATGSIGKFTKYNREFTSTIEVVTINKDFYMEIISALTTEGFEPVTVSESGGKTWIMHRKLLKDSGFIFGAIVDFNDLNTFTFYIQYKYR